MPNRKVKVTTNPYTELPPIRRPPDRSGWVAVFLRYARLNPKTGRPLLCQPSRGEIAEWTARGWAELKEKIIFDSPDAARQAARELQALGAAPMRPYPCERSRHGHAHLTSRMS